MNKYILPTMVDSKSLNMCEELLESTRANIADFIECDDLPKWASDSIYELLEEKKFEELNDRFFKTSEFGTGGIRGRTVGKFVSRSEQGNSSSKIPEHAAVGSVCVNDFNVVRATMALFRYCRKFLSHNNQGHKNPTLVISRDTRCFSKHFCELCASTWSKLGGQAFIFDAPRSTPQLSFSVRCLHATAGVMITASHNPWHDNGFKAYFSDGAQMVDPHASGVVDEYGKISIKEIIPYLDIDLSNVTVLEKYVDDIYLNSVAKTVIDDELLLNNSPSVAFTPLHGVGAISALPLMDRFKIKYFVVESQNDQDPLFNTVKSPNPENKEALNLAIESAKIHNADVVLATDPDDDRVAIVAKNKNEEYEYFSGNMAWSMLLEYRLKSLFDKQILSSNNSQYAVIIKTFVTTPLIEKIAKYYNVKCINTLTGFKWIGEKINDYELDLAKNIYSDDGISINYDLTTCEKRKDLLLKYSNWFIFGCEESYGCLSSDVVRDKDANSAVLMLCELAAYAKQRKITLCDLKYEIFKKYGYFGESVLNIYYNGVDGAKKIANILSSYREDRPSIVDGARVVKFTDFKQDVIVDADGKKISKQDFFFIELNNGCKYAVRASGTEPKIKFYIFCERKVDSDVFYTQNEVETLIGNLKGFLEHDAARRSVLKLEK